MAKKSYSDKLKDPRWQKKRLEILERDGWKCSMCGDADSTLTIHHKYYIYNREPWEYSNETLITLCLDCHESETERKYIISDFAKVLLSMGFTNMDLEELLDYIIITLSSSNITPCMVNTAISLSLGSLKTRKDKENGI